MEAEAQRAAKEAAVTTEKLESSVEKYSMVMVDKKQATVAWQVARLEATTTKLEAKSSELEMRKLETYLKASRVSASPVMSQKRVLESSFGKNKKNNVYMQEMEVKLHGQLQQLEAMQSSELDRKHVALVAEMSTLKVRLTRRKPK